MYHTLAKQVGRWTCNLVAGVSLSLLFVLLCSATAVAQTSFSSANPTMASPTRFANIAGVYGVTAYPLNKWGETAAAADLLAAINSMQPSVLDGSATPGVNFRYIYYSLIYRDITQHDMAVEVSMLKQINEAMTIMRGTFLKNQVPMVYSELVTILNN
jgi:hypothetical protein